MNDSGAKSDTVFQNAIIVIGESELIDKSNYYVEQLQRVVMDKSVPFVYQSEQEFNPNKEINSKKYIFLIKLPKDSRTTKYSHFAENMNKLNGLGFMSFCIDH